MKKRLLFLGILSGLISCSTPQHKQISQGPQSQMIIAMINAVNQKNADHYVLNFSDDIQVYLEGKLSIDGRDALQENRAQHFKNHPQVRSEIQHLVEIDNKVILHDKVWLEQRDQQGKDIVEVFTFKNQKIMRVDVIQPSDLFK